MLIEDDENWSEFHPKRRFMERYFDAFELIGLKRSFECCKFLKRTFFALYGISINQNICAAFFTHARRFSAMASAKSKLWSYYDKRFEGSKLSAWDSNQKIYSWFKKNLFVISKKKNFFPQLVVMMNRPQIASHRF